MATRQGRAATATGTGWRRVLLACWALGSGGQMDAAESLTIATYNVANYNVAHRRTADGFRPDYPKPEAEKAALRRVIRELDADVLALQELGGPEFLRELQRDLLSEGCGYPHAAILVADDEPRHLGALSRRPFVARREHTDLAFPYRAGRETVRRGLLELRVAVADGELALFIVHLKSRYTDRRDDPGAAEFRAGEALAVRDRVLEVFPVPDAARFVILGDCNDDARSRTLRALLRRGDLTISRLVDVQDSRGDRWTHHYRYNDSYSRVDHVLVSPGLAPALTGATSRIYDGPGVREASDHRPVVVTLHFE